MSEQKYILLSNLVFGYSEWAKQRPQKIDYDLPGDEDDPGTYFATPEAKEIIDKLFLAGWDAKAAQGWISVEDRLPKLNEFGESDWVLIFCVAIGPIRAYYAGEVWCDVDNEYRGAITHWMPLPSPPGSTPVKPDEDQEALWQEFYEEMRPFIKLDGAAQFKKSSLKFHITSK